MIKVISNAIMKKQLKKIVDFSEMELFEIPALFLKDFIEWDSCVLFGWLNVADTAENCFNPNEYFRDRTEFEAFSNHIYINDYFPELEECSEKSLSHALKIADIWEKKIKLQFSSMKFHLIISYDEFGAAMRLYKYRADEGSWINIDDIEGYLDVGILVKEIYS